MRVRQTQIRSAAPAGVEQLTLAELAAALDPKKGVLVPTAAGDAGLRRGQLIQSNCPQCSPPRENTRRLFGPCGDPKSLMFQ